jgi:hypothetical protein
MGGSDNVRGLDIFHGRQPEHRQEKIPLHIPEHEHEIEQYGDEGDKREKRPHPHNALDAFAARYKYKNT